MSDCSPEIRGVASPKDTVFIVASLFNQEWVDLLLESCRDRLVKRGFRADRIFSIRVPGAFEIPWALDRGIQHYQPSVAVGLGVVIQGDTSHHHVLEMTTATELLRISRDSGCPVVNGIITTGTLEQAKERCQPERMNRGSEFADAALALAALNRQLSPSDE